MAKKTTKRVTSPKELSRVAEAYIQEQMYKISVEDIASDLALPLKEVQGAVDRLRSLHSLTETVDTRDGAGQSTRNPDATPPRRTAMDELVTHSSGAAVMTAGRTMQDDIDAGTSPFTANVTEAQKKYIKDNMNSLSEEAIAKDTGLKVFEVRQAIDGLNPARSGREKFFARNSKHLHKLRPDEPIR